MGLKELRACVCACVSFQTPIYQQPLSRFASNLVYSWIYHGDVRISKIKMAGQLHHVMKRVVQMCLFSFLSPISQQLLC